MATLREDINTQAEWIRKAFAADNLTLDYSINSLLEIDKFFNKHTRDGKAVKGGRLSKNLGPIVFSIGAYIGQTIIKAVPGTIWEVSDNDPEGEINAAVKLPDGTIIWPIQKTMKRFQNGSEDSIYLYGHHLTKDFTNEPFNELFWDIDKISSKKTWWKFW